MTTGYGVEVSCTTGLRTGRLISGWRVVAEALYRRVTTSRGTLRGGEEEAAYGTDLAEYIGAVGYSTAVNAIPGIVAAEWSKDDRVQDVDVKASITTDAAGRIAVALEASVLLVDEGGSFDLTINIAGGEVLSAIAANDSGEEFVISEAA